MFCSLSSTVAGGCSENSPETDEELRENSDRDEEEDASSAEGGGDEEVDGEKRASPSRRPLRLSPP